MVIALLVLVVLVVVLYSQVQGLRVRLEAVERVLNAGSQPAERPPAAVQPVGGTGEAAGPVNRPADPRMSPWPVRGPGPERPTDLSPTETPPAEIPPAEREPGEPAPASTTFPGVSFAAVQPRSAPPAAVPRQPVDVQRWLTRAGIVATLLGVAYVLAVLEAQGLIGAWWRVLAGLLLGGWLTWRAERAARSAPPSGTDARPGWVAEALGSLGVSVALLTLTFAARAGGSGGLWAAVLTVLALASVLLSRRWNGLTTPLVALVALVVALPSAQGVTEVRPAPHLWGLEPLGLVCMVWALSALALLPLLVRAQGWRMALPGAAALLLLSLLTGLSEFAELDWGRPGQQAGVVLLVSAFTLVGVLLRRATAAQAGRLEETLRSVVGTLALGTLAGAFCRLTGLDLRWAVPLAVLPMLALLSLPARAPGHWTLDPQVLPRVTFSAALAALLSATGYALALHSGDAGRAAWLPALASLAGALLVAWRLQNWASPGQEAEDGRASGWRWHGVRVSRLLLVLSLCAPLALLFGLAGLALPLVVWLARRQTGPGRPAAPALGWSWSAVRAWQPAPLAVWGLLALPLLSSGAGAGSASARFGETALLLLGGAGLLAHGLARTLHPLPGPVSLSGQRPWLLAALLAWSGSWLLATVLGRVQGRDTEEFVLTTPLLALLGGWLLFRAQPARPGDAPWKWGLWLSGAGLLVFALLRVLLSDLSASDPLIRAAGLLGAGLVTVLAGVRFPPPSRS